MPTGEQGKGPFDLLTTLAYLLDKCAKNVSMMRHEKWLATFELRDEDPKKLTERILARPGAACPRRI